MTALAERYEPAVDGWGPVGLGGRGATARGTFSEPVSMGAGSDAVELDAFLVVVEDMLSRNLERMRAQAPTRDFSWLTDVYALNEAGETDDAVDMIFDRVDDLLLDGEAPQVDDLLNAIDVKRLDITLMLAALSITKPAADRLQNRLGFVGRVEGRLREVAGDRMERLLSGLR
jgi:hypothetical protein